MSKSVPLKMIITLTVYEMTIPKMSLEFSSARSVEDARSVSSPAAESDRIFIFVTRSGILCTKSGVFVQNLVICTKSG